MHTAPMILLAVAGAVVLAMVSWAALREAQRMPQTLSAHQSWPTAVAARRQRRAAPDAAPPPAPPTEPWRVSVPRDVTVADADNAEALAAAGALWHLMVRERSLTGR